MSIRCRHGATVRKRSPAVGASDERLIPRAAPGSDVLPMRARSTVCPMHTRRARNDAPNREEERTDERAPQRHDRQPHDRGHRRAGQATTLADVVHRRLRVPPAGPVRAGRRPPRRGGPPRERSARSSRRPTATSSSSRSSASGVDGWAAEWEHATLGRNGKTLESDNAFVYRFDGDRIAEMWMFLGCRPNGSGRVLRLTRPLGDTGAVPPTLEARVDSRIERHCVGRGVPAAGRSAVPSTDSSSTSSTDSAPPPT